MRDIIFVSMENWDEVWRRNQFLCVGLARACPRRRILFVGLPRDVSHQLRRGKLSELRGEVTWSPPGLPNIVVTRPLKVAPNSLATGRRLNEALARAHVRRIARKRGLRDPILWLNPHYAVHMAGRMGERAVIYDVTDDWISLTQSDALRQRTVAQDAELCRRADAVIVCSQRLFDLKREEARNIHLIPNGVDAEHYQRVLDGEGPLPAVAQRWPRPVLGYTGTLHPDRIDVPLIEALACGLPDGTVALVGPNLLPPDIAARLLRCGNVAITGAVPYQSVPDYMRAFDVCVVPHRITPFTESLNPIKLWEYLAAGKPVVSTDVAGFRDYPQLVRIAAGAEDFVRGVREALLEGGALADARRQEARGHSWEVRLAAVECVLRACTLVEAKEETYAG